MEPLVYNPENLGGLRLEPQLHSTALPTLYRFQAFPDFDGGMYTAISQSLPPTRFACGNLKIRVFPCSPVQACMNSAKHEGGWEKPAHMVCSEDDGRCSPLPNLGSPQ
jgi:hypothetical protein